MKPLKKPKNACFTTENTPNEYSNLSGVTLKPLTINKLAVFTATSLPKLGREIFNPGSQKMINYKKAKVYDAGGDIKKQWYVYYSFRNAENKFIRFKVFEDINSQTTKAARYELANFYCNGINIWLEDGNSPFKPSELNNSKNIIVCIDRFLEYSKLSRLRANTKKKHVVHFKIFKDYLIKSHLQGLNIGEIKKAHIFEFIQYIKANRKIQSGKTINDYLGNVGRLFNHYLDNYDDFVSKNPAAKITREEVEHRGNTAYTEDEIKAIKEECLKKDPYLWFVCEVIYYTGLRPEAEALQLRCGDFDLVNNQFFVEANVAKNKMRQAVPIYPELADILKDRKIQEFPKNFYLFGRGDQPGLQNVTGTNYRKRFAAVKKMLGLGREFGIYSFKATRACHLFDDGATVREIQILFRHADPFVTMKYLKSLGRVERGRVLDKGRKI